MPSIWSEFPNIAEAAEYASRTYRRPRWNGQPYYAELWVEKQALAGVLEPLASKWHAPLMVNKGYSSQSAMYEAAQRFLAGMNEAQSDHYDGEKDERPAVLFYLGDHDPSGEDMVRDIRERMEMFGVGTGRETFEVHKLALTWDQIQQYKPPPNPAKLTDPRAAEYIAKHGAHSWEVDALNPAILSALIDKAFRGIVDHDKLKAVKAIEALEKEELKKAAERIAKKAQKEADALDDDNDD